VLASFSVVPVTCVVRNYFFRLAATPLALYIKNPTLCPI
jgi:hypothetical protein